jgi:hypothetical protein
MKTRSLLAIPLLVLLLAAAACGGSSDDNDGVASLGSGTGTSTGSGTNDDEGDPQESLLEFVQCMREHGVDMPDPDSEGRLTFSQRPNDDPQKFQEAQKACQDLLPQGRGPRLSEEDQQAFQEAALAFAECMRKEGIDMPDPQFGDGGGLNLKLPPGLGPDDPTFKAAQKKCQPIMQDAERKAGLGGSGGSTDSKGPGS